MRGYDCLQTDRTEDTESVRVENFKRSRLVERAALANAFHSSMPKQSLTRFSVSTSADITAEDLSPEERLAREAKTWLDRQVIAQECEWEPDHDLRLVIENVALDPRPRLWLKPAMRKYKNPTEYTCFVP